MALNILLKRSATPSKRPTAANMAYGELNLNYDAATGGVYYKDSDNNVVKVGPAQVSATAPNSTPAGSAGNSAGEFWYDTVADVLKIYDGAAWVAAAGTGSVDNVTGTAPITVDNTDPNNPIIGIDAATTSAAGAVQLSDSTSSTSTTEAATANAVKTAYDEGIQGQTDAATAQAAADAAQADATQALGDAAAAQTTADAALPKAGGTMSGTIVFDAAQTFSVTGIQDATAAQKGIVQVGTNIAVAAGVISVASASTSAPGVVQLNNSTSSTSTTEALTAAQGKALQDEIDALAVTSNLTLAGTFNASTGLVDSVTTAGTAASFVVGSALPSPAAGNADFFVIIDVAGSTGPAGTPPYHIGDWFLSTGTAWTLLNVGFQAPSASTSFEGIVYLATDAEVQAGSDTSNKAVIPSSLQSKLSDSTSTTSSSTIASSTAVKSAYDLADAAVPDAAFLAAGDLLVGSGAGTYAALSAGPSDYILSSDGAGGLVWVTQSEGDVTTVSGTAPITVDNTDPQNPVVGVAAASTSAAGVVQLNDTINSTSITEAATARAVKEAYDAAYEDPLIAYNTLSVNPTYGDNATGARGTGHAFATLTAALAAAQDGDFIFMAPGTYTENPIINKGVTILGTFHDQGTWQGTKILGNTQLNLTSAVTRNCSINNIYFISPNSTPAFTVTAHSTSVGNTIISDCGFTQATATDVNQFAFLSPAATWVRAIYARNCLFDGNVKHNAGTAAGASGYFVMDNTIGAGSSSFYYHILTGTVEFRSPTQALSPIFQTGGVVAATNVLGVTNNSATTTTIFGGTGFNYKGSAASVGTGTISFAGGSNVTGGKVAIGANLVYRWGNLHVTPANLTIDPTAVPITTQIPATANIIVAQQTRPRFDLLTTTSSVAAANQLATVLDSADGTLYTVAALDAGVF